MSCQSAMCVIPYCNAATRRQTAQGETATDAPMQDDAAIGVHRASWPCGGSRTNVSDVNEAFDAQNCQTRAILSSSYIQCIHT